MQEFRKSFNKALYFTRFPRFVCKHFRLQPQRLPQAQEEKSGQTPEWDKTEDEGKGYRGIQWLWKEKLLYVGKGISIRTTPSQFTMRISDLSLISVSGLFKSGQTQKRAFKSRHLQDKECQLKCPHYLHTLWQHILSFPATFDNMRIQKPTFLKSLVTQNLVSTVKSSELSPPTFHSLIFQINFWTPP